MRLAWVPAIASIPCFPSHLWRYDPQLGESVRRAGECTSKGKRRGKGGESAALRMVIHLRTHTCTRVQHAPPTHGGMTRSSDSPFGEQVSAPACGKEERRPCFLKVIHPHILHLPHQARTPTPPTRGMHDAQLREPIRRAGECASMRERSGKGGGSAASKKLSTHTHTLRH